MIEVVNWVCRLPAKTVLRLKQGLEWLKIAKIVNISVR